MGKMNDSTKVTYCDVIDGGEFKKELECAIEQMNESKRTLQLFQDAQADQEPNPIALSYMENSEKEYNFGRGYVLGMLKANYDTAPTKIAAHLWWNEMPIDYEIKLEVEEYVTEYRKKLNVSDITLATEYEEKYKRLSELICGHNYNMTFIEERFREFYPGTSSYFVEGFAEGYSKAIEVLSKVVGYELCKTSPKEQDIWKNYEYFLVSKESEYSLEGEYLFMSHGGINCSGDPTVPYAKNKRAINNGLYAELKSRDVSKLRRHAIEF